MSPDVGGAADTGDGPPPGPRFALLAHAHPVPGYPVPHFDLLLEDPALPGERRCRAWRLRLDPRTAQPVDAEPLPPHRASYLDYEGPVAGDRGTVARLDGGGMAWGGDGTFLLRGRSLRGSFRLNGGTFRPA